MTRYRSLRLAIVALAGLMAGWPLAAQGPSDRSRAGSLATPSPLIAEHRQLRDDVARALLALPGESPPPPENPMSADRVRWEHIQRVFELCNHNVSETARRLNMHRRTLQRILAKRAPR